MPITSGEIFEGIVAVSTLGAALVAAISSYIASNGAKAAQEAVKEARLARKSELAPRLVLERDFLDFHLQWPRSSSLNGEPVFLARKHGRDKDPAPPTFLLTNHGGGPALELQLVFEFDDPNGELDVPETFAQLGLSVEDDPGSDIQPKFRILNYQGKDSRGVGLPLYRRVTTDIANCAPGQTRTVDFPQALLNRLFLRGLQYWDRRQGVKGISHLVLSVRISCYTVDGEPYSTQFRFQAFPFYQGSAPMVVHGHFRELPMYPKSDEARVI